MIVVHHLENSRSQRVLWLLEELGVDYEIRHYSRDPVTMLAPPELEQVHPLGKSPVIEDDDNTVAESGAIIEYLAENYGDGAFIPAAGQERNEYRYWLHYAEASLMPWLLLKLVFARLNKPPMPLLMRPLAGAIAGGVTAKLIEPRLNQHFRFIESQLAGVEWLAGGKLSGADIQMSFPLEAAAQRSDLSRFPNIVDYIARIHARPAWQRALERGGPYEYA
ncbi:MAG: glutathione S-transferase [Gammaproteobacteria bacterium]|nr:glutathione S-transferase [Gammaproteobacteria bacterium]NND59928.1 glutathione S-transferase [Gammaproteobacteria bacterium]